MATGTGVNVSKANIYAVVQPPTGENVSKANLYSVAEPPDLSVSKVNTYSVVTGPDLSVSKLNVYAVLIPGSTILDSLAPTLSESASVSIFTPVFHFSVSDVFVTAATQSEAIVFETLKAVDNLIVAITNPPNLIKAPIFHSSDTLTATISEGTHFPSPPPSSINTTPQLAFAFSELSSIIAMTTNPCAKLVDSGKSNSIGFQF